MKNYKVDWHTHILPEMDDGSKDIEMSKAMLDMEYENGIRTVVLTSHYYAQFESIEEFLNRRSTSFDKIKDYDRINFVLGAEVHFFYGMSASSDLEKLSFDNMLLVEMPAGFWSSSDIEELYRIRRNRNLEVILAHIERYMKENKKEIYKLLDDGFIAQVSDVKLLKSFPNALVGSDCHNLDTRKPNLKC